MDCVVQMMRGLKRTCDCFVPLVLFFQYMPHKSMVLFLQNMNCPISSFFSFLSFFFLLFFDLDLRDLCLIQSIRIWLGVPPMLLLFFYRHENKSSSAFHNFLIPRLTQLTP
eukprot:1010785_1